MRTADLPRTLQLIDGECLAARGRAVRITVVSGRLWFTRPGDLRDHFLEAGASFVLRDPGALASAEGVTAVRLEAVRRGRLAHAVRRALHRLARTARRPVAAATGGIMDRCPNAATS